MKSNHYNYYQSIIKNTLFYKKMFIGWAAIVVVAVGWAVAIVVVAVVVVAPIVAAVVVVVGIVVGKGAVKGEEDIIIKNNIFETTTRGIPHIEQKRSEKKNE